LGKEPGPKADLIRGIDEKLLIIDSQISGSLINLPEWEKGQFGFQSQDQDFDQNQKDNCPRCEVKNQFYRLACHTGFSPVSIFYA
jgi:hypothetical protein